MNKKIEINSKVKDGKLVTNRKFIEDSIKSFEGKDIILTIEKRRKKRSNSQNAFYFGVCITMLQDAFYNATGEYHSIQEVHDAMKANFCFKEIVSIETGEIIKMPNSTTQLTTIEWEEYIDKIRQWAFTFLNISIGFPNEQMQLNLNLD